MSSHRRFAAAELKRTSPSPRVVSSESDDDVPEVSHPSQPRAASPRGDVVQDDLRGVLEAEAGGFATFDDDPSGLLGLRRIDTAETLTDAAHPWSFDRPSLGEARKRRVARFHGKRARRVWTKRVKYDVRKNFAETRLRVKGRFVKKEEEDLLKDLVGVV